MNSASRDPSEGTQLATRLSSLQDHGENNSESSSYLPSTSSQNTTWSTIQTQGGPNGVEHCTFQSFATSRYAHSITSFPYQEYAISIAPRESISSSSPALFSSLGISGSNFSPENFHSFNTTVTTFNQSYPEPYRDQHSSSPPSGVSTSIPENGQHLSPLYYTPETCKQEFSQFDYTRGHEDSSPDDCVSSVNMSGAIKKQPHHSAAGTEEPYAQLIYRAFMSTKPKYTMTLQDIYQWFRENTVKAKSDGKGWQNSIRHNLSMNQAFTKIQRQSNTADSDFPSKGDAGQICLSTITNPGGSESKKSTAWYLEPWAVTSGVQSTTRYRSRPEHGKSSSRSNRAIGSSTSDANKKNRRTLYAASPAKAGQEVDAVVWGNSTSITSWTS